MEKSEFNPSEPKRELVVRREPAGAPPAPAHYVETPNPEAAEPAESGGLVDYWRILRRHKGTLILMAFLGGLCGALRTLPQTPVYQARASLEIQGVNENFLNMQNVNPTSVGANAYYPEYDIQTQVKILQSASLVERVVQKLKQENRPFVVPETGRLSAWRKALGLPQPKPVSLREQALAMAAGNLKVRAQANTRLLEILCDSTDPQLAADFANALANEYIEENLEARWKSTQHTGEWLTRQMEDLRIKLEKSEEELQNYARLSGLQFTSEKDNIAEQRLRQLQDELSKAQADRIVKQSRYELAVSASADSLAEVLDDGSLRDYQAKLTELRRQIAELTSSLTPAHPRVKKVQAQIAPLEAALEKESGNIVRRIHNDYQAALRREKLLAAGYAAQARLVSEQADKVTHYNILKREVDTNRQLYDSMLQRVKEAGIASALRASNVRVVDAARPPGLPYKPDMAGNAMVGLLVGAFLGVVVVIARERVDRTVRSPGDVASYLNVPELGVIPAGNAGLGRRLYYRKRRSLAAPDVSAGALERSAQSVELATWQRKPSLLAESFRATLTSILFSGQNGDRPRVIVFTSPNPREGKTTVVSNLGIALAEISQRVLLIDGDLRKPRLPEIFSVPNDSGLTDLLRQKQSLDGQPLDGMVLETGVPGLYLLPSGTKSTGASNLLYSPRMAELLQRLRRDYDAILIDTPPMLQIPDARVLGRLADAVILVIRAAETTRDAAQAARQRFAEDGTPVLGTILNDWNPRYAPGYGYYRYYDRYYRRYYTDKS
jgi:succinoglycan biosynthesis transport protein ExoP